MEDLLKTAREAAGAAGEILKQRFGKAHTLTYKDAVDIATEADYEAEAVIIDIIGSRHPDHSILAEESGIVKPDETSGVLWIVDPLDGTTNFAHGYPAFCVSICASTDGVPTVGVIYDPIRDEIFEAARGGGAFLNGERIRVSTVEDPIKALVCTGFVYDRGPALDLPLKYFRRVLESVMGVRRDGTAALDLAYTACGRFDAFYELNLNPWDVAAGFLIVEEAGGRITGIEGNPVDIYDRNIFASNTKLHQLFQMG